MLLYLTTISSASTVLFGLLSLLEFLPLDSAFGVLKMITYINISTKGSCIASWYKRLKVLLRAKLSGVNSSPILKAITQHKAE